MKRFRFAVFTAWVLALLLSAADSTHARTLRWAGRGDVGTMDPHSFNEGFSRAVNGHVYEQLVRLDRQLRHTPGLAERWEVVNDTTWRFTLRAGVRFQDGTALTAADAVFSIERAQHPTSQQAVFARKLGKAVQIDERTFELRLDAPNPLVLDDQLNVAIMSRAWCKQHGVERPPDFTKKEEAHSMRHAMGTGPFMLESFEPGVRTVLVRNPSWWGTFEGNVTRVVYTPITNDATRTAALLSGALDLTLDAPPQDLPRLAQEPSIKLTNGLENRIVFLGMDQQRNELKYASVKGRNPFKDPLVREAFALAIDTEALKTATMRGQSRPTACMAMAPIGCYAAELDTRPPADGAKARRLLAEAGYADGFEITLDCPNDRYVNDRSICIAVAGMLSRVGVKVRVDARSRSIFFPKIDSSDTSFWLYGWGGGVTDPQTLLDPMVRTVDPKRNPNAGGKDVRFSDAELDRLIDAAAVEMNVERRRTLLADAQRRTAAMHYWLPLHWQMVTWASRRNVTPVPMPDNVVRLHWVRVD